MRSPCPRSAALALAILVLCPTAPAFSWTDATRTRMIQDALKASPPTLRDVLEAHGNRLMRGMLDPSQREGEEVHFQHADGRSGLGAKGAAHKVEEVRSLLLKKRSLKRFTYEMGTLAHLIVDASFPLNVSDADPREPLYREAYRKYIETKLDRIPFVFNRGRSKELTEEKVDRFIMSSVKRAESNYALIGRAFDDDGKPRARNALDERSVPFGIASLAYSEAVSNVVLIWRQVWTSVNGDLTGTPYLDDAPEERVAIPPGKP
jgi:hypothetical protein